jgi:RNA polymerase subunit RPABC4/transcription elongation factor Spt4
MQCTCGAQLPDDARFCHRCGKPQFEEDINRLTEAQPSAPPPPPPSAPPSSQIAIDFGNRRALVVSIAVALLTLVVFTTGSVLIPGALLVLPLFCFAGYTAARWYIKQTGELITPQGGARLGFMTALWAFLVVAIFSVVFAAFISSPEWRGQLISILSSQGSETAKEMSKLLQDPRQSILVLMGGLLVNFCLFTFSSMLGGMLGVHFSNKR